MHRSTRFFVLGWLAFVAASAHPSMAQASSPFLIVPDPAAVETTPAYRYANMTNEEAIAELDRRNLPYVTVDPVEGVRAPIRLTGRLHGVHVHSALSPEQRLTSPFEILDARLALALDDFTAILERHDIDEIVHYTMYRPNVSRELAAPKVNPKPAIAVQTKETPAVEKPSTGKPPTDKPLVVKVASRDKPIQGRTAEKRSPMKAPAQAMPKVAPVEKADKPVAVKPTGKPTPEKPVTKPSKTTPKAPLGKAVLGPKTAAATTDRGVKQKAPVETVEKDQADKPVVVVTAPEPKKEEKPRAATNPAWAPPGTRHPAGLAIDVGKLRKKDGTWISVLDHFHGKIGDKVCGDDAPVPESAQARELRTIVCESLSDHVFTYVLTPNYNAAHADHFHMEIKPGVKWFLVH